MGIMNELKNRGVKDMLLAAVDGLTGFPEAIAAVFPKTEVHLCLVRNSVRFVPYKDRKAVIAGLKAIYLAPSAELAADALEKFAAEWDKKHPMIAKSWRSRWNEVIPFFKFSPEIRKAVYTTNAIESVNFTIQKIIKHRQSFPNDEAAMKLIFMGLKNIKKMDNVDTGLGCRPQSIRNHLWGRQSPPMIYRLHKNIYKFDYLERLLFYSSFVSEVPAGMPSA
jgi:transposase-like protein